MPPPDRDREHVSGREGGTAHLKERRWRRRPGGSLGDEDRPDPRDGGRPACQQQTVEIAKALSVNAKINMMSRLSSRRQRKSTSFSDHLQRKAEGRISHRLEERAVPLWDRVTTAVGRPVHHDWKNKRPDQGTKITLSWWVGRSRSSSRG